MSKIATVVTILLIGGLARAQNADTGAAGSAPPSTVSRTVRAVYYAQQEGSTHLVFQGTSLMKEAHGEGKAESGHGLVQIKAEFSGLGAPHDLGPEYLTFVLWAISGDGRALNLGEIAGGFKQAPRINISTICNLQMFGMIITAEPYSAVTQPSDLVVLENVPEAANPFETADVRYELLARGVYTTAAKGQSFTAPDLSGKAPFELIEAQNAIELAELAGAGKYSSDTFTNAKKALEQAQNAQSAKPGQKQVIVMARLAAELAEDSRVAALRREAEERQEQERAAAKAREDEAIAHAAAEAKGRAEAAAEALASKQEAERQKTAAEQARRELRKVREEAARQQKEIAEQAAQTQQASAEADRLRQATLDRQRLRQQLLDELNQVLETRDTDRGLVVNIGDPMFDPTRRSLTAAAQLKLARLSGIVVSHPGLKLQVEASDSNVHGSQKRADAVRDELVSLGIAPDTITAQGVSEADAGKQQNRRAELVMAGDLIGATVTEAPKNPTPAADASMPTSSDPFISGAPFSLADILNCVGAIADGRLSVAISHRGINFKPSEADYDKLKKAGAGKQVTEAIATVAIERGTR